MLDMFSFIENVVKFLHRSVFFFQEIRQPYQSIESGWHSKYNCISYTILDMRIVIKYVHFPSI
jgi:hypothetical protein